MVPVGTLDFVLPLQKTDHNSQELEKMPIFNLLYKKIGKKLPNFSYLLIIFNSKTIARNLNNYY